MPTDRRAFILGSAAFVALLQSRPSFVALAQTATPRPGSSKEFFFLTEREARFLRAAVDHLIPRDDYPSASEVGAVAFFDLQLATDYGQGDRLYLQGPHQLGMPSQGYQLSYTPAELYRRAIAEVDRIAGEDGFAGLSADGKETFLKDLQDGRHQLGDIPGKVFFDEFYQNTLEAYFADPIHNANADLASWKMIGFPGAHAYYLTEVDRYNMAYGRPPSGIAYRPGVGSPELLTPDSSKDSS